MMNFEILSCPRDRKKGFFLGIAGREKCFFASVGYCRKGFISPDCAVSYVFYRKTLLYHLSFKLGFCNSGKLIITVKSWNKTGEITM